MRPYSVSRGPKQHFRSWTPVRRNRLLSTVKPLVSSTQETLFGALREQIATSLTSKEHHRILFRRLHNLCVCAEVLEIRVNLGAPVGHMFRANAAEEVTDNETLLPSRSDSPLAVLSKQPGTRFMDGEP